LGFRAVAACPVRAAVALEGIEFEGIEFEGIERITLA